MTNSWRSLARMARDRIVSLDNENVPLALSLWSLRLTSLARLRLFNQAAAECTNLFSVLDALPSPGREYVFDTLLPFELEVFRTRLKYWAGDHMGYLDELSALLKRCKNEARRAAKSKNRRRRGGPPSEEDVAMWKERGARVCLIIASQLAEMKDYVAATSMLEPLLTQPFPEPTSAPALRSAVGRIYLQAGHIEAARKHFAIVAADPNADFGAKAINTSLLASADGQWERAEDELRTALQHTESIPFAAINNLSVALLAQGKISDAIVLLEEAFTNAPARLASAEPFLFNLATLYELCAVTSGDKKRALLIEVSKWSGDGLRAACLKMPTN